MLQSAFLSLAEGYITPIVEWSRKVTIWEQRNTKCNSKNSKWGPSILSKCLLEMLCTKGREATESTFMFEYYPARRVSEYLDIYSLYYLFWYIYNGYFFIYLYVTQSKQLQFYLEITNWIMKFSFFVHWLEGYTFRKNVSPLKQQYVFEYVRWH